MPLRLTLFALVLALFAAPVQARDRIQIVGSLSALELVQPVAENFARHWGNPTPSLEVTGTGAGFELFSAGVGFEHADAVAATRPMTEAERAACRRHGITQVTEIEFGRDAMVLIRAEGQARVNLTRKELFAALAAEVVSGGRLVANTSRRWSDVDPQLPNSDILVMAPAPNTAAALAFYELALAQGCLAFPQILALPDEQRERACRSLRRDGRVVHPPKYEHTVASWLQDNKHAFAVTSYTMHKRFFADRADATPIEGVEPSNEAIAARRYPLVTGLYVYVKDQHVKRIPSLQQFLYELTSERALGPEGYLAERGLVSLDDIGRNKARDEALKFGL